jgi:hypothetical protein
MKSLTFKTAFNTVAYLDPGMGEPCFSETNLEMTESEMIAYVVRILGSSFTNVDCLVVSRIRLEGNSATK